MCALSMGLGVHSLCVSEVFTGNKVLLFFAN